MRILGSGCLLFVLAAFWTNGGHAAQAEGTPPYGIATVAPFKKAPVIDGKIEPGEWDGAAGVTGFQGLFAAVAGMLEPRGAQAYLGFDQERLYIAVVSAYPPDGKDHSSGTTRDKEYIGDECIEVWLDPNRANRESQQGDLRFYQLIANAQGGIYDVSFDPKKGPDTGWNGKWEFKNSVDHEKHVWTAELSLPFSDLGWKPGEAAGKTLGVLIARNFKGPWSQTTWFPVVGAFVDWFRYATLKLTAGAPSVQITGLGAKVHKAELELRAKVFNPGPARQAKVSVVVTSSDMPEKKDEKLIDLPAGGSAAYAFDDLNRLHEDAQHALRCDVTSPDGSETYMHYSVKWAKAPEKLWEYRVGPDPSAALRFAYYPSYKFVRVMLDTRELSKELAEKAHSALVTITGPQDQEILKQTLRWDKPPCTQEFKVGGLKDGEYTLAVAVDGWNAPIVRTFKRTHFPFEGNTLGITDDVLPPFTPLETGKDKVALALREYEVNGLGLWKSAKVAGNVSAGGPQELLAGPVVLKINGGEVLEGQGKFTEKTPARAVYEGKAKADSVAVATRCTTDVDGCTKIELTLKPGGKKGEPLNALWCEVPLVDKLMPLWHVSTTGLRINPAGSTPAGEGQVWDSRKFPDGNWYGNFKCYLWLGAEERGFCWFADNDNGWELAVDEKNPEVSVPCQELIRAHGTLTLRINLIQKPVTLTEPRTLVFGIMTSPAKPMAKDWRRVGFLDNSAFNMGYANYGSYCAKAPWGNDFSIADWAYRKRTGKGDPSKEDLEAWKARNFPKEMEPKFREGAINLALGPFLSNFSPSQKYYKMYFDEFHSTSQAHAETHVFQSEWGGGWYGKLLDQVLEEGHKMWGFGVAGIVRSHQDFACWYAAEWLKRGIGLYFDNAFPIRAYDPLTTSAYRLPNGQIQPSAGMWARRDYLRRIWTLHRQLGPKDALPAMMIHMTNTHLISYMGWNDENLDLEWKFGPEPQQSKFAPDFLRAESLGRQSGNVAYVLDKISDTRTAEEQRIAHRTKFGAMMVHELRWWGWGEDAEGGLIKILKDFGYALEDCQVWNYWDEGYPVKASDPEAKSLLLKRNGKLLLLICTWNPKAAEVTFQLDAAKAGLKPTAAVDAEKPDQPLKLDGAALTLPLESYGVRMVELK
ncbi:MAG: glycoside hydrolase domain-containing protein [Planctomycetota bacterium]